ncbi:S41 family peptidase [Parerythrobacter jejuensis]|uniref:Peptidase S41 n=1 Tax=Parerythrobacter jejuensis TaxID=795812 RepID=A0A845AI29_9SPHN|nr:S41 family peptidase [Parerythrobacter jejuensis]MXP30312.1 peptidase S41 [Parerythrobacter jejuensis]MXP33072.1 peptidase S41 [Parerythrobacter jejuensis]
MDIGRTSLAIALAGALVACGGGGSSGGGGGATAGGGGGGGTSTPAQCSLRDRQDWAFGQIDEFYLFPNLIDRTPNPASFNDLQEYINAIVAPARAQSRDRFFTFITSITEENALINSGSSAGFGIRLAYDTSADRVFLLEAFENGPAFAQGFDRGTELLTVNGQSVANLMASGGPQAVIDQLGPSDPGVTRTFRIRDTAGVERDVSVTKADFSLDPISDRYGVEILNDGGKQVGYINLRTFIVDSAGPQLREAVRQFRDQGITEVILDFRYNGGGLVSVAELLGDLMAADKVGDVFSRTTFRDSLANNNETDLFRAQSEAIAATKIAFIGRGGTASASELVANSFIPYLGNNTALIGANTFGKPVGQIARDRDVCDDRLRVVAFQTQNRDNQGEYFTGLASVFPRTCQAGDDIFTPLGDPSEASISTALDFLAGRPCNAISGSGQQGTQSVRVTGPRQELLQPEQPSAAQYRIPGLF